MGEKKDQIRKLEEEISRDGDRTQGLDKRLQVSSGRWVQVLPSLFIGRKRIV